MTPGKKTIARPVMGAVAYLIRKWRGELRLRLIITAVCVVGLSTQSQAGHLMSVESGPNSSTSVNSGDSFLDNTIGQVPLMLQRPGPRRDS